MSDRETPERRRGRPPVAAPLSSLSIRLPPTYQQRLKVIADQRGQTMSTTARQLLILRLPPRA